MTLTFVKDVLRAVGSARSACAAALIAAASCSLSAHQASAALIYENLNGRSYGSGGLYFANYETTECNGSECFQTAQDFDLDGDYTLTSISLPLAVFSGAPNSVRITLYQGTGGLPGPVVETWLIDDAMIESDSIAAGIFTSETTVMSVLHPVLTMGTQYFVGFEVPALTTYLIYGPSTTVTETRTMAHSFDHGATWSLRFAGTSDGLMAMRIDGEPAAVPEPAAGLLLAAGLAAFLILLGRQRGAGSMPLPRLASLKP